MKRRYLKVGDRSSVGGTVVEGMPLITHHKAELAFVGASVMCPVCNSTGKIAAKGPRWPGELMGKHIALEGDVCSCKCYPLPVMLPSQSDMTMSFESHELADMGFGADGISLTEKPASEHWIKFALSEERSCEGLNCRAHFADGSVEHGTFDAQNEVHFERPNSSPCEKLEILSGHDQPAGSLIHSLLLAIVG